MTVVERHLYVLLLGALALGASTFALAQEYPVRPIRVIVPFSPGGAVDGPMRLIAQSLTKRLGQAVVVENKPGAGATIGTEVAAKAPPDGYTLLLASQTNAISATLYTKLTFDPIEDFTPIALIGREPGVVVVNPALPVTTPVSFTLNGKTVVGHSDETILETAQQLGIEIPRLCYMEGMRPDGNCRALTKIWGTGSWSSPCCRRKRKYGWRVIARRTSSSCSRCSAVPGYTWSCARHMIER